MGRMIYLKREHNAREVLPISTDFRFFDRQNLLKIKIPRCERYGIHGDIVTVRAGGEDTDGAYCLFETKVLSARSSSVRPHAHVWQDETTMVHSGRFEFVIAGRRLILGPGDVVHVPHGVIHTYRNMGAQPGRLWAALTPAGLEGFFREVGIALYDPHIRPTLSVAGSIPSRVFEKYGIAV